MYVTQWSMPKQDAIPSWCKIANVQETTKAFLDEFEPAGRQTKIARDGRDEIEEIAFAKWLAWYMVHIACVMELNRKFIFVISSPEIFILLLKFLQVLFKTCTCCRGGNWKWSVAKLVVQITWLISSRLDCIALLQSWIENPSCTVVYLNPAFVSLSHCFMSYHLQNPSGYYGR